MRNEGRGYLGIQGLDQPEIFTVNQHFPWPSGVLLPGRDLSGRDTVVDAAGRDAE